MISHFPPFHFGSGAHFIGRWWVKLHIFNNEALTSWDPEGGICPIAKLSSLALSSILQHLSSQLQFSLQKAPATPIIDQMVRHSCTAFWVFCPFGRQILLETLKILQFLSFTLLSAQCGSFPTSQYALNTPRSLHVYITMSVLPLCLSLCLSVCHPASWGESPALITRTGE